MTISLSFIILLLTHCSREQGKHLFILSGQSNMVGLQPDSSFTPIVADAFGENNVIVVKDAHSGQPIRRWYRQWKPAEGESPSATGDLYDSLMFKVNGAIKDTKLKSVTWVWMQGERDAREKQGEVYAASLLGLIDQLSEDFDRDDIYTVIGRLSDFDLANMNYPHWTMVRDAQVNVAEESPRYAWINTDDLNDGTNRNGETIQNDLHYSKEGYGILGRRFAEQAIALIHSHLPE